MKKNNQYEQAKKELVEYEKYMIETYNYHKSMIDNYKEDIFTDSAYDLAEDKRFCQIWEIINELPVSDKNLFLLHQMYNGKIPPIMAVFNGLGGSLKNAATVSRNIWKIKKKIRDKYEDSKIC